MSVVLTSAQNRFLRGQAHGLKAVLQTGGKGLTDAFFAELEEVLERHELIKVKLAAEDHQARDAMIEQVAKRTDSAVVQRIGHVVILYRPSRDKRNIVLPRA
ncbi:MAG: ribosome assembly RNA-binding protein YhbY [Pseudoxanthomonas sp.]|jgi:RNA-binding protein